MYVGRLRSSIKAWGGEGISGTHQTNTFVLGEGGREGS